MPGSKVRWHGVLIGVQPRIRLTRSFDERSHAYQGYVLRLMGWMGDREGEFCVAIGAGALAKHRFRVGDAASGEGEPVPDPRLETADLYKASALKVVARCESEPPNMPPWRGVCPELPVYRQRGHRRLDARTYDTKCTSCQWGCRMAVEMIVDHWNPSQRRYRTETFCYGPRACPLYRAGPTRKVPGRKGMSWEEGDWVDEDAVAHRGPDE